MSNILQFDATTGTSVDGTNIAAAPASTNYSGVYATDAGGDTGTSSAFSVFPHSTTDSTTPFTWGVVVRKTSTTQLSWFGEATYAMYTQLIYNSSTVSAIGLVSGWSASLYSSSNQTINTGDTISYVVRGVWSSGTTYDVDIFYGGTKYSGSFTSDPAYTPTNFAWPAGAVREQYETVTHTDAECIALATSLLTGFAGGSADATGTGSIASITLTAPTGYAYSVADGTGTGSLHNITLTAPAGTASGSSGAGTITTPVLKNNTGTVLASETTVTVNVYHVSTGALIVQKTGQTSNSSGIVTIADSALAPGTTYAYEVILTGSRRRLPIASAA